MYINIDVPNEILAAVEQRGRDQVMKRPEIIRYILKRFIATPYPVVDVMFICPSCAVGNHCGGGVKKTMVDLDSIGKLGEEVCHRWICRCPTCEQGRPAEVEVSPDGETGR